MRLFGIVYVAAVCFLFLINLCWQKTKTIYDCFFFCFVLFFQFIFNFLVFFFSHMPFLRCVWLKKRKIANNWNDCIRKPMPCIYEYIYIYNCRKYCLGLLGFISACWWLGWRLSLKSHPKRPIRVVHLSHAYQASETKVCPVSHCILFHVISLGPAQMI